MLNRISFPSKIWLGLFGAWFLLLSGVFSAWIGSPGMIQAYQLSSLLKEREDKRETVRQEIVKMKLDYAALEKSRAIQLREIRRVLGYVSAKEMVFDFASDVSE